MFILDRSVRRRVDCIFCFVCLFLFLIFSLQRNEGFCVCSFGLQSWRLLTIFLHFHPGSRTLRVMHRAGKGLVVMMMMMMMMIIS